MSRHPDIEAVLATRKKRKPYKRPRNAPGFAGGKFNPKFLGNPLAT